MEMLRGFLNNGKLKGGYSSNVALCEYIKCSVCVREGEGKSGGWGEDFVSLEGRGKQTDLYLVV